MFEADRWDQDKLMINCDFEKIVWTIVCLFRAEKIPDQMQAGLTSLDYVFLFEDRWLKS